MKRILLWLACIPAGIIAGTLVLIIYQLLGSKFIEAGSIFHFIESLIGGALSGAAAVYVAAYIAPSHKKWVAAFLSVVVVISMAVTLPEVINNEEWSFLMFTTAQDIGSLYITYLIFKRVVTFE
jgi:uncharacterized membrane protein YccC